MYVATLSFALLGYLDIMEDSQFVVPPAVASTDYPSTGQLPAGYAASNPDATAAGGEADPASSAAAVYPSVDNTNPEAKIEIQNSGSVAQEAAYGMASESENDNEASGAGQNIGSQDTTASTYPVDYSSLNGTAVDVASYQSAGVTENGVSPNDASGQVLGQPYEDGIGISCYFQ